LAFVEVNGVRLAYDDRGDGPHTFVFIHGWACDRSFWQPQFDNLSRNFRCVSVDLRGCGESAPVPPYDTMTAAEDVTALIEELKLPPVLIVGHSLGGIVGLLVNDMRPELVHGLVLSDSPLTAARSGGFAGTVRRITEAGSMEPMRKFIEGFFTEGTPPAVRERVQDVMLGCDPGVGAGMLGNASALAERLDAMVAAADKKPLMAIWAEKPQGDPEHMRDITMFIRQEPIAGGGHFFQLEQPDITNALLRAFVDDVERDPRLQTP